MRAQEAVKCYGAHAYLASCAMCGAAAETILLSAAVAKKGEAEVLTEYRKAGGRKWIEGALFGKSSTHEEAKVYLVLMKYWRDEAAHGERSAIGDNEAYTSLAMLLRFAQFIDTRWTALTSPDTTPSR